MGEEPPEPPDGPAARALARAFLRDGCAAVRGALAPAVVAAFVEQVQHELLHPPAEVLQSSGDAPPKGPNLGVGERAHEAPVDLRDRATWPRGPGRRVVELTPRGDGLHWAEVARSPRLAAVLDALAGPGNWYLPANAPAGEPLDVRHWYFPVTFPELCDAPLATPADPAADPTAAASAAATPPRPVRLGSWREEHAEVAAAVAEGRPAAAAETWQPVSRRRFRGKGWHIDVGPGFPMDGLRTPRGHPFQCAIVLLVLNDWAPGGGGTCAIAGSHRAVAEHLAAEGAMPQDELNKFWTERCKAEASAGRLWIGGGAGGGAGLGPVVQFTGRAGDVILLHPLVLHSGTTNWSGAARLMGNGMVRWTQAAFDARVGGGSLYNDA